MNIFNGSIKFKNSQGKMVEGDVACQLTQDNEINFIVTQSGRVWQKPLPRKQLNVLKEIGTADQKKEFLLNYVAKSFQKSLVSTDKELVAEGHLKGESRENVESNIIELKIMPIKDEDLDLIDKKINSIFSHDKSVQRDELLEVKYNKEEMLLLAKNDPFFMCKKIKDYNIKDEKFRGELFVNAFEDASETNITKLITYFENFELTDNEIILDSLKKITFSCYLDTNILIFSEIANFKLNDRQKMDLFITNYEHEKLYDLFVTNYDYEKLFPIRTLHHLKLSEENVEKLAFEIVERVPKFALKLFMAIDEFEIKDQKTRSKLFLTGILNKDINDSDKRKMISNINAFLFDDDTSFEIVRKIIENKPSLILENLNSFCTHKKILEILMDLRSKIDINQEEINKRVQLSDKNKLLLKEIFYKIKNQEIIESNKRSPSSLAETDLVNILKELDSADLTDIDSNLTQVDSILKNFAKTNEDRIAIAEIYAKKKPEILCAKIDAFQLEGEPSFLLAKILANKCPQELSKNILNFNIKEHRVELAKIIKEVDMKLLSNFNLNSDELFELMQGLKAGDETKLFIRRYIDQVEESKRFQIAKELKETALFFCYRWTNFKLDPDHYFEFCIEAVRADHSLYDTIEGTGYYFDFNKLNEEHKFEIAKEWINRNIQRFYYASDFIQLLALDPEHKLQLANMAAEKDLTMFLNHILNFYITDPKALIHFVDLANRKGLDISSLPIMSILRTAMGFDSGPSTINALKQLNLKDPQMFSLVTGELAKVNIGALCYGVKELAITDKTFLYNIALQAAGRDAKAICENIQNFDLTLEQEKEVLTLAAKEDPYAVAANINNFKKISDRNLLTNIIRSAVLKKREGLEGIVSSFGYKSLEEIDQLEIEEVKNNIIKGNTENEALLQEKIYRFNPDILAKCGNALLEQRNPFQANWGCRFLEKAARLYQKEGNIKKAIELRLAMAHAPLIYSENPLTEYEDKLKNPITAHHPTEKEDFNLGVVFNSMDSQALKGGHFRVCDIKIDKENKRQITFSPAYWAADAARENLLLLKDPENADSVAKSLNVKKIEVREVDHFYFYPLINGEYDTAAANKVDGGLALTVNLEGLAKIEMGLDQQVGSIIDKVRITMNPDASPEKLQEVLAIMGLTNMVTNTLEIDKERLKVNALIHFFYPRIAATRDRNADYHEKSIPLLLGDLEKDVRGLTKTINKYRDKVAFEEIDGIQRLCLDSFVENAEKLGARGLFAGISRPNLKKSAETLAGMLKSGGLIPSVERLQRGLIIPGASMGRDLETGGGDGAFSTAITQSTLESDRTIFTSLSGSIQILLKTDVFKFLESYVHEKDNYGCRNPNDYKLRMSYLNRPNHKEFIKENQYRWVPNNEVMIKHRLDSNYIAGATYQDPRKTLIRDLENDGESLAALFPNDAPLEEKIAFISDNPQKVLDLLSTLKAFDSTNNTYKSLDVFEHWTMDPKKVIINALSEAGIPLEGLVIEESDTFLENNFKSCNHIENRLHKIEEKAVKLAGIFKTRELLGDQIPEDSSKLIYEMRNHFKKLSDLELNAYISEEIISKKIVDLRNQCEQRLSDVDFSGQDSLNRELLTDKRYAALRDKKIILALFALEVIKDRNPDADTNALIAFTSNAGERMISECLYQGLKNHPLLLEKLPNNLRPKKDVPPTTAKMNFIKEYVRRSNIEETFLPIIQTIDEAYQDLLGKKPSFELNKERLFNQDYKTFEFSTSLKNILTIIDNKSDNELMKLQAARYNPQDLKDQAYHGFMQLMKNEKLESWQMTKDEIIGAVTSSIYLLDPMISHLFYDRLHLLAALKSSDKVIQTSEGNISMRELMEGIITSFDQGVTENNAIAREQFYLRMILLYEKLQTQ